MEPITWSRSSRSRQSSCSHKVARFPTVVGWAGLESVCGEGSVTNIAVLPKFRRRGTGEALTRALLAAAQELALDRLLLEVRVSNAPAIALYEKLGFSPLGVRPGFYEAPREDALIMQRVF